MAFCFNKKQNKTHYRVIFEGQFTFSYKDPKDERTESAHRGGLNVIVWTNKNDALNCSVAAQKIVAGTVRPEVQYGTEKEGRQ